jgi:dipeptidyl aminopeptidase/acylaminoacyl peptidase
MNEPRTASYGSWASPISAQSLVAGTVGLGDIALDGDAIYWSESRPQEGGRVVLVRRDPDGTTTDVTPAPYSVRTRVHEYGGGAYAVADGTVVFSNDADGRIYRQQVGEAPEPLTPEPPEPRALRYADLVVDPTRDRVIAVREDHTVVGREPVNTLVSVALGNAGGVNVTPGADAGTVLVEGADFYASPALSPDGSRLAWLSWDHPNMPWDGTELWAAPLDAAGRLGAPELVAGGPAESIFQPQWSLDGVLHYVSDRTGWWNLYRWRDGHSAALLPLEAEFGLPQWVFNQSTYAFVGAERILCACTSGGTWRLLDLDAASGSYAPVDLPYTEIGGLRAAPGRAVFVGASPTRSAALVQVDLNDGMIRLLKSSSETTLDEGYLSTPEPVEFPTEAGRTAYAFYYPPRNRDYTAPPDERPPLIVVSHGGPTGAASTALTLDTQYWTSRGFAVLDVNYGGSTGYGRAYRERLDGAWGVVDVEDCVNGARYLVEQGRANGARLIIRGGSAGGYTTLAALTFHDVFNAGASLYGVGDLEALALETHKFESRYTDRLVAPYPAWAELYRARSPIHHVERLAAPVVFLQGLEDKVVPPGQAEAMVAALRGKGVPVAYLAFEGEGHGFRRAETIVRACEAELYFYARVFGIDLAEPIEPVEIDNL